MAGHCRLAWLVLRWAPAGSTSAVKGLSTWLHPLLLFLLSLQLELSPAKQLMAQLSWLSKVKQEVL